MQWWLQALGQKTQKTVEKNKQRSGNNSGLQGRFLQIHPAAAKELLIADAQLPAEVMMRKSFVPLGAHGIH
jgi:hypothetical protein